MILRMRTKFREDLGMWLRREPKYIEPKKLPFIFGHNHRDDRWLASEIYYNQAVSEDVVLRLWCNLHSPMRSIQSESPQDSPEK